jgi:hypothetical protein
MASLIYGLHFYNGFLDIRAAFHFIFDFRRRYVFAARCNNDVFLSINKVQVAIFVVAAYISGMQPTVSQDFLGGFRIAIVTGKDGIIFDQDLAII